MRGDLIVLASGLHQILTAINTQSHTDTHRNTYTVRTDCLTLISGFK